MTLQSNLSHLDSKPKYLFVIPSSTQLYSGTGTVIFDWIRFAKNHFDFSFLIDTLELRNFNIARQFCSENKIELIPSLGRIEPGCPDVRIEKVRELLRLEKFAYVECVSWANSASNNATLKGLESTTKLIYTPHWQPITTLQQYQKYYRVTPVFERMLSRADFVFFDSDHELRLFEAHKKSPQVFTTMDLGIDETVIVDEGNPDGFRSHFFSTADWREKRKRADVLISVYEQYLRLGGTTELFIAGNASNNIQVPRKMRKKVNLLGFVERSTLSELYRKSKVYISTSEYEAFGIPIAESLCAGTPVFLNRTEALASIYKDLDGVYFFSNDDVKQVARELIAFENIKTQSAQIRKSALDKFSFDSTYGKKLSILAGNKICK